MYLFLFFFFIVKGHSFLRFEFLREKVQVRRAVFDNKINQLKKVNKVSGAGWPKLLEMCAGGRS